ncbi:MAG TPA: hypothetical protein VFQ37_12745 [Mycobacterium sp.]|nr:hypothetical protein [Mycobacterium sp.]
MVPQIPDFTTQMRGFDRAEVVEYITRVHGEIETSEQDREQLTARVTELQNKIEQQVAQIAQLQDDLERASGPIESVEGMSERIARMMRIASDEARRTKELAHQEAEALTLELRQQVQAASQDRIAASEALAEFQVSNNARREKILASAMTDAEEILRIAHQERDRLAQEVEEAERSRRELYLRLAEEDERKRREAQESLDEQMKSAWEEDVRNRREAQRRMEQQLMSAWDGAEKCIANLDQEARLKASDVLTAAQREAKLLTERTQAEVKRLRKEHSEIVVGLNEIRRWIEAAVDDQAPEHSEAEVGHPADTEIG